MTEKGSSTCDLELKLQEQSNNLLQLQTNFNNLQLKYIEEKEKTFNLENKLKELNEKIQKINFDSSQKDEKINSLEEKIKNADKNIADLTINSGEINILNYVEIKNKWKEISSECCENKCINTNNPVGVCIEGNGFANLINDENIKYINCVENWGLFGFGRKKSKDQFSRIIAENSFKNPKNPINYSLFYFEIKYKIEKDSDKYIFIGFKNNDLKNYICLYSNKASITCEGKLDEVLDLVWWDNCIFGCGLVYPPTNKSEEFPYMFFTQNGKQIGTAKLIKNNYDYYLPFVILQCCSVETNFGNDLGAKPFKYVIPKHLIVKEFDLKNIFLLI